MAERRPRNPNAAEPAEPARPANRDDGTAPTPPEGETAGAPEAPEARRENVRFTEVLLTATRGQHPDSGSLARGYMGRDDEVEAHLTLHRLSDGTVKVKRHSNVAAEGTLVVLVLGMYEPGFPYSRTWSETEQSALDEELDAMKAEGVLAEDAPVYAEFGLPGQKRPAAETPETGDEPSEQEDDEE